MQFAPLYPLLYRVLAPTFPSCLWSIETSEPVVALTFDDGPHPEYTPQVLDVLEKFGIVASFFWLGSCVRRYPEVAKAVFDRGHWIGLHGDTHRSFIRSTRDELQSRLECNQLAISEALDLPLEWVGDRVRDVRPPNGLFTPQTLTWLQEWNYRPVMWSVVPEDWVRPGISRAVDRVLSQVRPGSVVVLHDGHFGGEDAAETTRSIVKALQHQTYRFVTINPLWQCKLGRVSG
ncbi:chitooligosaccharide deacetylase NodB-like protein [Leptolyngbya valderiana BDU 20041]|nr:chitooligosaccharide deacetylase NodB-like protein [Leptolyngbya valderiana BDU 20041]PPT09509.1 polysaccharide deacetylase [Geitlerinema sp. FC II]